MKTKVLLVCLLLLLACVCVCLKEEREVGEAEQDNSFSLLRRSQYAESLFLLLLLFNCLSNKSKRNAILLFLLLPFPFLGFFMFFLCSTAVGGVLCCLLRSKSTAATPTWRAAIVVSNRENKERFKAKGIIKRCFDPYFGLS